MLKIIKRNIAGLTEALITTVKSISLIVVMKTYYCPQEVHTFTVEYVL